MTTIAHAYDIARRKLRELNVDNGSDDHLHAWACIENCLRDTTPPLTADTRTCAAKLMKSALEIRDATISLHNDNSLATGLSDCSVFIASTNRPLAAIKIFPADNRGFAKELWATSNLAHVGTNVPSLLGYAYCAGIDGNYFLLASEYIDGISLHDVVMKVALSIGEERAEAYTKLLKIATKTGSMLGKLHRAGPDIIGKKPRLLKETESRIFHYTVLGLSQRPELGINGDDMMKFAEKHTIDHEYRFSYVHGDAHLGNFLVERARDRVVMLDCQDGASSFTSTREPLGTPYVDYVKIISSLRVRIGFGLRHEEFTCLRRQIDEGYRSEYKELPSKRVEEFYILLEIASYFEWYFSNEHRLAPDAKLMMQTIFNTGVTWLKDAIDGKRALSDY